jgi:hypothetical protein
MAVLNLNNDQVDALDEILVDQIKTYEHLVTKFPGMIHHWGPRVERTKTLLQLVRCLSRLTILAETSKRH